MKIKPLRKDSVEYLNPHNLSKEWKKDSFYFEENINLLSLNTELMEPHWRGIYSFRIDQ